MNGNRRGITTRICGWGNPEHGHEYEHEYGREGSGVHMNVDNDFTTAFLRQILTPDEFQYLVSMSMSMSMSTEGAHNIQAGKGLFYWSDCDPRHLRQIIRMIHHGYKYKYKKSDRSARARTRTRNSNDSNANAKRYQSINEIRMILLQIVLFLQECTNRNNGDGNGDGDACVATGAAVILTDEHEHPDTGTSSKSNYVAIELLMPLSYNPKEEEHEPSSSSSSHLSSRNPTTKPQAVIRVSHARARSNQAALAFFRDLNVDVDVDIDVDGPVDEPSPSSCSSNLNLNLLTLYTSHSSLLEFTGAGTRMGEVKGEGAADTDTAAVLLNFIQGCGLLDAPSGLEVHEGILIVPDYMRDFINVMGTRTCTHTPNGMDFMNMNIRGDGDEDNQRGEVCDGDNNNGEGCPFHSLRLDRILKLGAGAGAYSSHQNQTLVQDQSGQARLPQNPMDRDHHQEDHCCRNRNCDVDEDEGDSTYSSDDQDYGTEDLDSDSDSDSDEFASDSEDGYWGYEQECKREREHEYEHDDNSLQSGIGSFITCLGTISSLPDTMLKSRLVHTDHQHKYQRQLQFQQRKRRRWSTIMAILYSNILRLAFWSLMFSILFLIVAEWKARQYDDPLLQQYILSRRRLDIDVNTDMDTDMDTDMNIFHSNSIFSKVVFMTRYVYLHLHLLLHSYSYQYQYPSHFQFIPIAIPDWNDPMGENQDQDQYQKLAVVRLTFLLTGRQMLRNVRESLFIFSTRGFSDVSMIMSNINRQMRSVFRFESLWNVFVGKAGVIGNAVGDIVALGMNV